MSNRHAPKIAEFLILDSAKVCSMAEQRYRGGRKSKGEREALHTRVDPLVSEAVRARAADRGMSLNDFVASVLAREVGMTNLAPQAPIRQKPEELPISDVA